MESNFQINNGTIVKYLADENEVIIPEGITAIGNSAFEGKHFTRITFPTTLRSIGFRAFINCDSLRTLTIPDNVTILEAKAFMNCERIYSLSIGRGIKTIPSKCFFGCRNIDTLRIPFGVTRIGESAFAGTNELKHLYLPDSIQWVSTGAFTKNGFSGDSSLYMFLIASKDLLNRPIFEPNAFFNMDVHAASSLDVMPEREIPFSIVSEEETISLETVENQIGYEQWEEEFKEKLAIVNVLDFSKASKAKAIELGKDYTSVFPRLKRIANWPSGLKRIGDYSFKDSNFVELRLPANLESIGERAFADNPKLQTVFLGNRLTEIGEGAFIWCPRLEAIHFDGTKDEWKAIDKKGDLVTYADVSVHCIDGILPSLP